MMIISIVTGLATGVITFLVCHALVYPSMTRRKIERAEGAIEYLADIGVISSPSYWHLNYRKVRGLDHLLINASKIIKVNDIPAPSVKDALLNLELAGVICNPDYWEENSSKITYLDELLMKLGGCV